MRKIEQILPKPDNVYGPSDDELKRIEDELSDLLD